MVSEMIFKVIPVLSLRELYVDRMKPFPLPDDALHEIWSNLPTDFRIYTTLKV